MQELKPHPRAKIALIFVLGMIVVVLISSSGFGISDSSNQIPTAKAEYFPTADGNWMIQNMIPLTKNLFGVSCVAIDNNSSLCFAVGESGTLVKYLQVNLQPSYKWLTQPSFTTKTLRGVLCFNATSCYAVGGDDTANSGEIWAYNGTNWSLQANNVGSLNGIGCTANNCFALGNNGLILKQTGNSWAPENSGTTNNLNSFACYNASLCFAVGSGGTILNYDGTNWSSSTSGTNINLNGVSCYSIQYCGAVGNNGTILKYDGTNWSPQVSGTSDNFNSISCNYYCFAVGDAGTLLKFYQNTWSVMTSNTPNSLRTVNCSYTCLIVGDVGEILKFDGEIWLPFIGGQETQTFPNLGSVSCPAAGTCFGSGLGGLIIRFNGQSWSQETSGTTTSFSNISCPSVSSCIVVGANGYILHYDGSSWSAQTSGTTNDLYEIQCPSLNVCYAAGAGGTFLRYDGTNWSPLNPGTTADFRALSCPTTSNCFAVSGEVSPNFFIYDGINWSSLPTKGTNGINSMSCPDVSNCYLVGQNPPSPYAARFLHYDGNSLTVSYQDITHTNSINRFYVGINCPTSTDCTVIGTFGAILHYDGVNWSPQLSGTIDLLNGISCPTRDYCVIVGWQYSLLTKALVVNSPASANISGTLADALANAAPYQAINFVLPPNSTISVSSQLAPAKEGVQLNGKCGPSGPAITINGGGLSGSGLLTLNGKNNLYGLKLTNYNGKLLNIAGTGNKLSCFATVR